MANGVVLTWPSSLHSAAVYVIEQGETADGPWTEIARTSSPRYTFNSTGTGPWHFRLHTNVRGRVGPETLVEGSPALSPTEESLEELQRQLEEERVKRFQEDAENAAKAASDLLNLALLQEQALQAERAARELAVAAAVIRLDAIDDDAIISPGEKPQLITDVQAIHDIYPRLRQQMELAELDVEELDDAYNGLISYLAELNSPVPWNDTSGNTHIT